jgi:peptidoglycan/xylan/chitin deacetylase (PgdA/CDA1 family)
MKYYYIFVSVLICIFQNPANSQDLSPTKNLALPKKLPDIGIPQGIIVRTTENVTQGGWKWILNQCKDKGVSRVTLLVKQDEDHFISPRTGCTLQSGELLVPLPGEITAKGWEDATWLKEMLEYARELHIDVWAWWPCFHDAQASTLFPQAAYSNVKGEQFVDPGFPEVRARQSALIAKLLQTYAFDGISLDWVRFDKIEAGRAGPLGAEFTRKYGYTWDDNTLKNGYAKARWYELRAKALASWITGLVQEQRMSHPNVTWGAFLLPWHFTEVSQDYGHLSYSGLDCIQPMAYWQDWKFDPEWVGDKLLSRPLSLKPSIRYCPAFGINAPKEEIERALDHIPSNICGQISWFNYGAWEQKTFDNIPVILNQSIGARRLFGYEPTPQIDSLTSNTIDKTPSIKSKKVKPSMAKAFPETTSAWALVCLGELYRREAVSAQSEHPVIPVLALHTFLEAKIGKSPFPYKITTEYLDNLLKMIVDSGFTVIPLSRLQGYCITGDASDLPPRPLVITLDDGSESVYKLFYSRAVKLNMPFTQALVTGWLSNTSKSNHCTDEGKFEDPTMTWMQAKEMDQSGLMEVVSHSDDLHYRTAEILMSSDTAPAEITRQFLKEYQRTETNNEYLRRIRTDMITSRIRLINNGFKAPTTFCWPYGAWNSDSKAMAEDAGFTHFLLFQSPMAFASIDNSNDGIPRLAIVKSDEGIPLKFPSDSKEAQAWWLAFIKVARDSYSIPLIKGTIAQLTRESQLSPEVEMARASIDYLQGNAASGNARLNNLKEAHPSDSMLEDSISALLQQFSPAP